MRRFRNIVFYLAIIGIFSGFMYWIVIMGSQLETVKDQVVPDSGWNHWAHFKDALTSNLKNPLALLLAQIVTIIFISRLLGVVFRKIGQPAVIGEVIAGIILGPSLLGLYFPDFAAALFPSHSLGNLQFLSQIGLILFMFIVGMDLDLNVLKNKAHDAVVISHASIIIPFALGLGLAYYMFQSFAPANIKFSSFGLFLGISMSITAFPVLARIVQERGMNKTRIGTIAITCAAADDITAWSLLAVIIAIIKAGSFVSSLYTILLSVGYVLFMIKVVRPFLIRVGNLHPSHERMSKAIVAICFITLILSSYATEVIGIHALFGAFMAGTIMPENEKFRNIFIEKLEDVSLLLLLPLFFVFTGLRTEIGLLNDPYLWKVTGIIIIVAVAGKFLGSALAARFVGQTWKDSLTIGALMNTRGLMELVILNIGYDLGVLTPEVFAMMVIMALVTTFMTGPALSFINWKFKPEMRDVPETKDEENEYRILMSFGNPAKSRTLLHLASGLVKGQPENSSVTALHLSPSSEMNIYNLEKYEKDSFEPLLKESHILNQKITTLFKVSNDINTDITLVANKGDFDLLLVGAGQSIYQGSALGRFLGFIKRIFNPIRYVNKLSGREQLYEQSCLDETTRFILSKSMKPVGVLLDKDFKDLKEIFIPLFSVKDLFLLKFARRLVVNSGSILRICDVSGTMEKNSLMSAMVDSIRQVNPDAVHFTDASSMNKGFLAEQNFLLISIRGWKSVCKENASWFSVCPSTLILDTKEN